MSDIEIIIRERIIRCASAISNLSNSETDKNEATAIYYLTKALLNLKEVKN